MMNDGAFVVWGGNKCFYAESQTNDIGTWRMSLGVGVHPDSGLQVWEVDRNGDHVAYINVNPFDNFTDDELEDLLVDFISEYFQNSTHTLTTE